MIHDAFRMARQRRTGPVAVVLPFHLLNQAWDYDGVAPPPYPVPFDEAAYRRAVAVLGDRRARVGIYAGMGCARRRAGAGVRGGDPPGPRGDLGERQGGHPRRPPARGRLGLRRPGDPAAEKAFKEVDVVLAVGVKYSENSTASYAIPKHDKVIHVDACAGEHRPERPDLRRGQRRRPVFFDRLVRDAESRPPPGEPGALSADRPRPRPRPPRERPDADHAGGRPDDLPDAPPLRPRPGRVDLRRRDRRRPHWAAEAIDLAGPRRYFTPANNQSMGWAIPAALWGPRRSGPTGSWRRSRATAAS